MSIFPTQILLATDGSEEAELALSTAVDLANSTNSQLHVVTVVPWSPDAAYAAHEVSFRWEETYEEASEAIKKELPHTSVLVLTALTDPRHSSQALEAGAEECVLKYTSLKEIIGAIRSVLRGQVVAPEGVTKSGPQPLEG